MSFPARVMEWDYVTPLDDDVVRGQIAHACGRGLAPALPPRRRVHIIANGPSAEGFDFGAVEGDTCVLNGALELFRERDVVPTYWCANDPQEDIVASFLRPTYPAHTTEFLVGSKCHRGVFDLLPPARTRIWHTQDHPAPVGSRPIRYGPAITATALFLLREMGYGEFDVWGWDCCFLEGEHHARGSSCVHEPWTLTVGDGGPEFTTTIPWAAEADNAHRVVNALEHEGAKITIHGPGLVAACLAYQRSLEAP